MYWHKFGHKIRILPNLSLKAIIAFIYQWAYEDYSDNSGKCSYFRSQDYESEFSAITKKVPNVEGRFAIEADWKAPNRGFYLSIEEKPAGFAIRGEIDRRSDIAEFYILSCYRKKGFGKTFAFAIFDSFPGLWQVRQIPTAIDAISFWRTVIHEYTDGDYQEDRIDDLHWGSVIRQCFESRA